MNYREVELLAPADIGAAGTKIIDIDVSDPISAIEIIWQTTVNTASAMTAPHAACISKIELVDGSEVLASLSGEQVQALAYYTQGTFPLEEISVKSSEYMRSVMPIYFGRRLFDPELALDPTKFRNLQLKITWDEDAANSGVTVNELTVRGWVFDDRKITPTGFLMSKEIKSYTPAADSYEYTDLPLDYPYRLIMLQAASTDKNPFEVLAQVRLSEDQDKKVPIDMTGYEILRKICQRLGPIVNHVALDDAVTAKTLYMPQTYDTSISIEYDDTLFVTAQSKFAKATFAGNKIELAASVDIKAMDAVVTGYAPHFCMAIPLGDQQDISDWYDVTKLGSLKLTTQGASAVGTSPETSIILQQLRKY